MVLEVDYGDADIVVLLPLLLLLIPLGFLNDVVDIFRDEGVDARFSCAAGY